jgi:hypothetical protein
MNLVWKDLDVGQTSTTSALRDNSKFSGNQEILSQPQTDFKFVQGHQKRKRKANKPGFRGSKRLSQQLRFPVDIELPANSTRSLDALGISPKYIESNEIPDEDHSVRGACGLKFIPRFSISS